MYVILVPNKLEEVLATIPGLVLQFVSGEPGAEEVLCDLLKEHALWVIRTPGSKDSRAAQEACIAHPEDHLFWVGLQRIRENRATLGLDSVRRGWHEVKATSALRSRISLLDREALERLFRALR